MAGLDHRFGTGEPFSIGIEEELFLVDPLTGRQVNSSAAVLERLPDTRGTIARELHACQVELITEVCATAVADPVSGLHVHVGMPDPETAIRVYNALRRDLPLLQALAANSPFRHGRDTGLASAREVTLRAWPRSSAPRALRDFADFCAMTDTLARAADVPDYTWFWWKLRPHPRLGTVEIRALDAQTNPAHTASIVALVHCLARHAAQADPEPDPAPEIVEEGIFRAARFGVEAELPDASGARAPVRERLADALTRARPWADELGCTAQLAELRDLVACGGGAGAQRAVHAVAGIDAVTRELTQRTAGAG